MNRQSLKNFTSVNKILQVMKKLNSLQKQTFF
jgi:hypothetical protein